MKMIDLYLICHFHIAERALVEHGILSGEKYFLLKQLEYLLKI